MECIWIHSDSQVINKFIHWGNTLRMDFTEKEFLNYRTNVMGWLSEYWQKKGEKKLSEQYFSKVVDVINLEGELAHISTNSDGIERHSFRQAQLTAILSILSVYKADSTIRWANIKSWISIVIAAISLVITIYTK